MEFEKIREIISEQLGIAKDKIQPDTNFAKDLGADSLDIYQVITVLEGEFGIEFSNEDAEKITTVGDVAEFISNAVNR